MKLTVQCLILFLSLSTHLHAGDIRESLAFLEASSEYINLSSVTGLKTDLRYASTNNFVGKDMYGEFNRLYLHKIAAEKIIKASQLLKKHNPELSLLIFDGLRPGAVQKILWDVVKGTAQQKYVANPEYGSVHNYGFAVDLTIVDQKGNELDMGTAYDDFTKLSQPRYESEFLKNGKLTNKQLENRKLLRKVMTEAGFIQLPLEWWHFDALPLKEVKSNYRIIE